MDGNYGLILNSKLCLTLCNWQDFNVTPYQVVDGFPAHHAAVAVVPPDRVVHGKLVHPPRVLPRLALAAARRPETMRHILLSKQIPTKVVRAGF